MKSRTPSGKFLSPLVRNIAAHEGISYSDLDKIAGTGMDGRITRDDILRLLDERKKNASQNLKRRQTNVVPSVQLRREMKIIEMDRVQETYRRTYGDVKKDFSSCHIIYRC